jgi:hypothetical protein
MFRKTIGIIFLLIAAVLFLSAVYDFWKLSTDISYPVAPNLIVVSVALISVLVFRQLMATNRLRLRHVLMYSLLFIIGITMSGLTLGVVYTDFRLKDQSYSGVYANCYKVWGARGLVPESRDITHHGSQNSIESIQLAFDSGAQGTEVDVFFDTKRGEFIVSHDYPYNLKNGKILTLESLFKAIPDSKYFWLDFKKMRHLDKNQLAQSVYELQRMSKEKDLKSRIYVEGEAPFSLAAYQEAGFNTIFDTHPLVDSHPLTPTIINLYKIFFYFGDFTVMGMNFGDKDNPIYGEVTRENLGGIPVFVYHVEDDINILKMLSSLKAVRVILVENHSLNRYHINACQDIK